MIKKKLTTEQKLRDAQNKAARLFEEVEKRRLIVPGRSEKEINIDIFKLAFEIYGIKKYWHKRIVRAGKNTLYPYQQNPPNLIVGENDIVFLDFGPVFEDWEADFGRTYVLGENKSMKKVQKDINVAFIEAKHFYKAHDNITAAELYHQVATLATKYGWELGGAHCGHLIGKFPHEKVEDHEILSYIHPDNGRKLKDYDLNQNQLHWILEIHFVDFKLQFGGFTEELLTIG